MTMAQLVLMQRDQMIKMKILSVKTRTTARQDYATVKNESERGGLL
jgi:hypothetical protein